MKIKKLTVCGILLLEVSSLSSGLFCTNEEEIVKGGCKNAFTPIHIVDTGEGGGSGSGSGDTNAPVKLAWSAPSMLNSFAYSGNAAKSDGTKTGYYNSQITFTKYTFSDTNNTNTIYPFLLSANVESWFVPGIQATNLKPNMGYDGGQHNNDASIQATLLPYGTSKAAYKDCGPQNTSFLSKTISSSFEAGITYGSTNKEGISLDNASISHESSGTAGLKISYSSTYTVEVPTMNSAPVSDDNLSYKWNFAFNNSDSPKDTVFHFVSTSVYEIKPSASESNTHLRYTIDVSYGLHGFWYWDINRTSLSKTIDLYL